MSALAYSLLFHRALQRVLVFPGEVENLRDLGLRHFVGIDTADADTFLVHMQHDLGRILAALVEEPLQHVHHEFHRGVVVVQKQHLVEARFLGLRRGPGDDARAA